MNKKILVVCTFFVNLLCYSQQQFNYNFYIDDTVREGALFYNAKENTAIYLDKISSTKRVIDKDEYNDDNNTEIIVSYFSERSDLYFLKNNNEVLFTYNLLKNNYLVEDKLPKIEWELSSEKREIENLICYKATTTFRGRNWTAWYSPDIPINYGPWKFYGLPGLIIELKEDTNRFAFALTDYVLKSKDTTPTVKLPNSRKVTMKKMAEITDEAYDNLFNALSGSKSDGVEAVLVKSNTGHGQGIEAIYEWETEDNK